ncbi:ketosynthase chain-length factor [Enemella evansiae]|uniref:beta-ketoacyl synthase N-terminal-like domain-containing protein n=1 Tax=Enemella evansiae TaxID=2016499 RepID=UPI000B9770CD|nr:beta-ketoacyl synthase N-terminal-like domain-containing protein [Enemella evansiae]OYO15474.1 ketosynthase chain-length factor [Enemella evansiae]
MSGEVVITGLGLVSPLGAGIDSTWQGLVDRRLAIRPLTLFDPSPYWATLAGEFEGDPSQSIPRRLRPQTDRMTQLSLMATDEAVSQSGLTIKEVADDTAVVTAATGGGYEFGQRELQKLWAEGPHAVSAYQSFAWFYAVNTGQISIQQHAKGPGSVIVSEQAGGLDALGHAARVLTRGEARYALAGAVDSSLCPWAWVAHQQSGALSASSDPQTAYRPFAASADGGVVGEGGAMFVLAREEDGSGVPALARILGHAATFDGRTAEPGHGLQRAMTAALDAAGIGPGEVDVVMPDAAGVRHLDQAELAALTSVFGSNRPAVSVPKTATGRLMAGGAAMDVAVAIEMIRRQVIPPTIHVDGGDLPGFDLVEDERHTTVETVMIVARGRGGYNSALVLGRP